MSTIQQQHGNDEKHCRHRYHDPRQPTREVAKKPHDPDDQGNRKEQRYDVAYKDTEGGCSAGPQEDVRRGDHTGNDELAGQTAKA